MADKILLITESKIKSQTIIESNVDSEILSNVTWQVQEMQLKSVLTKTVYDAMITEVSNQIADPTTYVIAEPYLTLLGTYIEPFMLCAIASEFAFINNFKISNKGVMKLNDNSANNVSMAELESLRNYYYNQLSVYKTDIQRYLKDNNMLTDNCPIDKHDISPAIGWYFDLN